jgi:protein TonB
MGSPSSSIIRRFRIPILISLTLNFLVFAALPLLNKVSQSELFREFMVEVVEIIERIPKPAPPPRPKPPPEERPPEIEPAEAPIEAEPEPETVGDVLSSDTMKDSFEDRIYAVSELDGPVEKIKGDEPEYPQLALKAEIEGFVKLMLLIDRDGSVAQCQVLKVEGYKGFANEAVKAVKRWKFKISRVNGRPVQINYLLPIRFQL